MRQYFVVSLVGTDRYGLVDKVTAAIREGKGNLEDSRMAVLGTEFAMMILCSTGEEHSDKLEVALTTTSKELGLLMTLKPTSPRPTVEHTLPLTINVRGMDNEGIVHEIVRHLVSQGIAVEHLDSNVVNAPYSGVPLFEMQVQLRAPASISLGSLRKQLAGVADQLNVDIDVQSKGRFATPR